MYIPKNNRQSDKKQIVEFIQRFSFGTIITVKNKVPIASHLPFLVTQTDKGKSLQSHFAKANEQWKDIENTPVLVIFSEPHAYISPKHYEKDLNVPTWNYMSVHAYGQGQLITEMENVSELLERTIDTYEIEYKQQWNKLPQDFRTKMMHGIVAFEINMSELQAKEKLSQNKTENERKKIIESLSKSNHSSETLIATYMKGTLTE
ncbi:PaiB family negative transcriptional regulator [Gelidibacter algens]|uniref:PaiB family negative transcriptional regulator n=1 Tax=Gelidibacter algens TaxID=49280 RepID=A0A1A7QYQ2_9FLAO|nr:FMN-binding negative transcriptional regulator [Gelidibacter algens]OBX25140.1 transcriptional regulator [Gelidibacter algens]RAJ20028.1 PaiB family negative transcriptional regulator [Gelidibacter algens]